MKNVTKRSGLAWALAAAPVVFFVISLLMGRACPGTQMFWALLLVSHMPCIALPFWAVFHGRRKLGIYLGWLVFFLGEVGFFLFYAARYKDYGWPSPEVPGGIFISALFGWGLGWMVVMFAELFKQRVDRYWPLESSK